MTRATITATILLAIFSIVLGQGIKPAPKLELNDVEGRALRLGDYKGKVVLLNFWATWCAPCRAEMPDLVKWQLEYKSKGLQVIGVTYPPTELTEAREFIKSIQVNYPVVLGDEQTKAMFDKGETLPVTVVIDKNGMVREIIQGIIFREEFEQKVKPLLRLSPSSSRLSEGLRLNRAFYSLDESCSNFHGPMSDGLILRVLPPS